jgi:hypothetical protein
MKRAAVLIGVDKTGDLPRLRDAARGARRMEEWARRQGMNPVTLLTDEQNPVDAGAIKRAIRDVVDAGADQLVVYFAGHGVNIQRGEYWLLSDAPRDSQAAVNVEGSNQLARYSGIPHVVFISDACRTAAAGIQAQSVRGSEIFPNDSVDGTEKPVDLYFACTLGRPAHEVIDPNVTTAEYTALYTHELTQALLGQRPDCLEWAQDGSDSALLRPRALKAHLAAAVLQRIKDLQLQTRLIQEPDARLTSDGATAWLSRLTSADVPASWLAKRSQESLGGAPPPLPAAAEAPPNTVATLSASLLQSTLANDTIRLDSERAYARTSNVRGIQALAASAERIAQPFGPTHFETRCGFKIRGARIVEAYAKGAQTDLFETPGEVVRVNSISQPGANVLLVLEQGKGILLPAIEDFIAVLTVEEEELVDVSYEPSDNSWRWAEYETRAPEIRALRSLAASSMTQGVFRLEQEDALEVAKRMQFAKGVDPTLAVYAAYAYNDLHRRDLIRQMSSYMRDDIGAPFFDIALLAGELNRSTVTRETAVYGQAPFLAQGWALLSALGVALPQSLSDLARTLAPSVWTMFNEDGVRTIRNSFQRGDLK